MEIDKFDGAEAHETTLAHPTCNPGILVQNMFVINKNKQFHSL